MPNYDAGEITTNDVTVPVQVDDLGRWMAEYAGQHLFADTRDKLKGKLARLTRTAKVEVSVPLVLLTTSGIGQDTLNVKRGVAYGIHGGTGNVMVTWTIRGKEVKEQISRFGYSDEYVAGDTTDEQLKEYAEIIRELSVLRDRKAKWLKAHEIKPKEAVQRAVEARLGTQED